MAEQLSLFERMRGIIGKPEPTQEQWLTSTVRPDFSRPIVVTEEPEVEAEDDEEDDLGERMLQWLTDNAKNDSGNFLKELIKDPSTAQQIIKQVNSERSIYKSNQEKFDRLKNITVRGDDGEIDMDETKQNAIRFITEGLGYENREGTFRDTGNLSPEENSYLSGPINGKSASHIPGHLCQECLIQKMPAYLNHCRA